MERISEGLKNMFESAMIKESLMFESLKFYCILISQCSLPVNFLRVIKQRPIKGTLANSVDTD